MASCAKLACDAEPRAGSSPLVTWRDATATDGAEHPETRVSAGGWTAPGTPRGMPPPGLRVSPPRFVPLPRFCLHRGSSGRKRSALLGLSLCNVHMGVFLKIMAAVVLNCRMGSAWWRRGRWPCTSRCCCYRRCCVLVRQSL